MPDEIVDKFCVIGNREQIRAKLRELESMGVSEFNIYPHVEGIEGVIEQYGREFAPDLRAAAA